MTRGEDGFSLVELMVVVLILAALVSIAVPVFVTARTRAEASTCMANRTIVERAAATYRSTENTAAASLQSFVTRGYVKKLPTCPGKGVYLWKSGGANASDDSLLCSIHFAGTGTALWTSDWTNLSLIKNNYGSWKYVNGKLVNVGDATQSLFTNTVPADFRFEADATLGKGPGYGFYFRSTTTSKGLSGYAFQFDPGLGNKFVVRKVTNGAESGPIVSANMPPGYSVYSATHHTTITAIGDHIVIKVDGVPVLDFNDKTYSSGQVGVRSWGASSVGLGDISVHGATP